jgi:hypothetical protein
LAPRSNLALLSQAFEAVSGAAMAFFLFSLMIYPRGGVT